MKNLLERQRNLIRINNKRSELGLALQNGLITEEDIINLLNKDINYGVRNLQSYQTSKNKMLKNILNCPFLLCDQDMLSNEIKILLPHLLSARYNTEKDALKVYLEQCLIDENEYNEELENLNFFYYESSNDGKSILETGHAIFEKHQVIAR